jgi:hypothetical protein
VVALEKRGGGEGGAGPAGILVRGRGVVGREIGGECMRWGEEEAAAAAASTAAE